MSLLDSLHYRLRVLLGPGRYGRELDEEIEFHLSLEAMQRESAARGALSAAEARSAARRRFGNPTTLKEEARHVAGLGFLDVLRQDASFALRSFRRTPAFTAVAVLTLAIGIGATTAIFGAVNALLLRPLPYSEPDRLMSLGMTVPARGDQPARENATWSYPKFATFREAQQVFSHLAPYMSLDFTVRTGDGSERVTGEVTGADYLRTLGLHPALGRDFGADEDQRGAPRVALIGDGYWQRQFNADPRIVGQVLTLDGDPYTIVGVMPPGFRGLTGKADVWVPLLAMPESWNTEAWNHSYFAVARLAPGVSPGQAIAETRRLGAVVDAAWPDPTGAGERWGTMATPLDAHRVDPLVRTSVLVMLGAVALVLLIACANVANLFLVRAAGRRREIAVRLAVGAGRRRLVRQLLTESLLLALMGGLAGVALAWWGTRLLAAFDPTTALRVRGVSNMGAVGFDLIRLDGAALAFAALLTIVTGLLFGLVPALQATRPSLTAALKEERGQARPTRRGLGGRDTLAIVEVALAVVLLAGSGLMLRSLGKLLDVSPGVGAENVLTMRLTLQDYELDRLPAFYDEMQARLSALPGVTDVALANCLPLSGGCNGTVLWRRDRPEPPPDALPRIGIQWVTPDWFRTLEVPLVRGRLFTDADRRDARKVVLVSETAARRIWPGEDPLGKPVSVGQGFYGDTAYVVGLVGDVRFGAVDSLPKSEVYLSFHQAPYRRLVIHLRTAGDPVALAAPARAALHELAPDVPVYDVRPLSSRLADATAYARFSALLLALFAAVALALAAIGVYGVISFAVSQRTREIGVRVALGASPGEVTRLVVGQSLGLALAGAVLGLAGAFAATRMLRSLLYDVAPTDPATYVAIIALLVGAVLVASWLPARRAARVQPAEVLREA